MCPVSGVSRNEGLDSRFFSVTSSQTESAAAGGSCFPSHPRKRLPVLPRPARLQLRLRSTSGRRSTSGQRSTSWPRLRRCPAEGGVARPRHGERARDILGTRSRCGGSFFPWPPWLASGCPSSRRLPGWSCRVQVLALAACVRLCICPGFV